jgi:hypothetical protein
VERVDEAISSDGADFGNGGLNIKLPLWDSLLSRFLASLSRVDVNPKG